MEELRWLWSDMIKKYFYTWCKTIPPNLRSNLLAVKQQPENTSRDASLVANGTSKEAVDAISNKKIKAGYIAETSTLAKINCEDYN
jgi:hypothetical protein